MPEGGQHPGPDPTPPRAAAQPTASDLQALSRAMALAPEPAEAALRGWVARFPASATGWAALAQVLQRAGRHADALGPLQQAAAHAGGDAAPLHNLGNGLRRLGRLDEAEACYRQALALQPERASSHYGLGNVRRDQGRPDQAVPHFQAALRLQPSHAMAALALGNALQELDDLPGAARAYLHAARVQPAGSAPLFNLHAVRLAQGDLEGAIAALREAWRREPGSPRIHFFLALLLHQAGHADEAAALRAELQHGPAQAQAWLDAWDHLREAAGGAPLPLCGHALQVFRLALAAARPDGLVLEFGVRWGRSIRQIASLVDGPVHGFDSFEGLPEAWHDEPSGSYSTGGRLPEVPPQVQLHVGWFDATLPAFLQAQAGPVRFVNIDCDLYSSTRTVLDALAPRLGPGSVLVFDEYVGNAHWRDDEFKAFQEAAARHGWRHELVACSFATKQVALRLG